MVVQEMADGLLSRHTEVSGVLALVFLVLYLRGLFRHQKKPSWSWCASSIRIGGDKIPKLGKYNFKMWKLCLMVALESEQIDKAVKVPLAAEDRVNRRAMVRILESVSDEVIGYIDNAEVAYHAMQNLERQLGKLDYNQLTRMEESIKTLTLEKFDEQSVNAHLTSVRQQIQYIKESGGAMDPLKERSLIAATLPKDSSWSMFIEAFKYGTRSLSECEDMIRVKCRSIRTNLEAAFLTKTKTGRLRTKDIVKEIDIKEGRCFKCHNKDKDGNDTPRHSARMCPLNKVGSSSSQSARAVSSRGRWNFGKSARKSRVWPIDSAASSHFNNDVQRFETLQTSSGGSVALADGSTRQIKGSGVVNLGLLQMETRSSSLMKWLIFE